MIEKLQNKSSRKYFYVLVSFLLVSIFLLRNFLIPYLYGEPIELTNQLFYNVLDKIFTSVLVTVGLGTFVFWLTPKNKLNAQIKILQPVEIGETIVNARTDTERWIFNGGSGRYTRTQTLPYLAELSQNKNKEIDISILIMNPKNHIITEKYAEYKNSLRTAKLKGRRTKKSVQMDLISTIVSCHIWKTEQPALNITLCLKNSFSLFRTDLSSSKVIITKEDPIEPAILYEKGTFFYSAQLEELKQVIKQNEVIQLKPFVGLEDVSIENIEKLLIELDFSSLIIERDLEEILEKSMSRKNPYA